MEKQLTSPSPDYHCEKYVRCIENMTCGMCTTVFKSFPSLKKKTVIESIVQCIFEYIKVFLRQRILTWILRKRKEKSLKARQKSFQKKKIFHGHESRCGTCLQNTNTNNFVISEAKIFKTNKKVLER